MEKIKVEGLILKSKKETKQDFAHVQIFHNKKYLGYYTKAGQFDEVGANWHFSTKSNLKYFWAKTKKELLETVVKQINMEPVILKQNFGIRVYLNGATKLKINAK